MLIDDFSNPELVCPLETKWRGVSDQVMGGISEPSVTYAKREGKFCLRLSGDVRLENNGGFIQASLDLAPSGQVLDASAFQGVEIMVYGNNEEYGMHLRTSELDRPQQSYRQSFTAKPEWQTIRLPFDGFKPHRTPKDFDVTKLRRIGVIGIGRAFSADLCVGKISLY